jgi:hypothetical protein
MGTIVVRGGTEDMMGVLPRIHWVVKRIEAGNKGCPGFRYQAVAEEGLKTAQEGASFVGTTLRGWWVNFIYLNNGFVSESGGGGFTSH